MSVSSRVQIGKVWVDRITIADMLRMVRDALDTRSPKTFFYANAYAVTLAEADPTFSAVMGKADGIFCDGFGVYIASRLIGQPLPQRFTPPDWLNQLGETCRDNGASMFFLGGKDGVAALAANKLEASVPGLEVNAHHGHFEKDELTSLRVIDVVNRPNASVLLVGFGMPLQEIWITRYRAQLKPLIVFSVGALFDYAAGNVARGPAWLTQHGFEWLSRLLIEPRRLWRRYLFGLPQFGILLARQWVARRPAVHPQGQ
jgi:N-acetylglucosaminyldiphosphoundecaprenol N-acetyl-beta-D-mannosaminyltransferase